MALKQLILARKISELEATAAAIETERTALTERRSAWQQRESAAEAAFAEITDETPAEEREAFDAEAAEIETERAALESDEAELESRAAENNTALEAARAELAELNAKAERAAAASPAPAEATQRTRDNASMYDGGNNMPNRDTRRERIGDICTRDDVKSFARELRASRGITNKDLAIPEVMLPMIEEDVENESRLLRFVRTETVRGEGKTTYTAGVPEAIWTDTFGTLKKVDLSFYRKSAQGGKLTSYVSVPNPIIEDNDVSLVSHLVSKLAAGQARGIDRAIIYGTGTNMPVGIMTRLGAAAGTGGAAPAWWDSTDQAFVSLAGNIGKASKNGLTGLELYKELITHLGKIKHVYQGSGIRFWAMSDATKLALQVAAMEFNSAAAIVAGVDNVLPIIGGEIVTMSDGIIPDNVIIGGYGDQYQHINRSSVSIRVSDQVNFIEDETVYASVSRHDGKPLAGEGFAAFSLTTTAPATTTTWPTESSD